MRGTAAPPPPRPPSPHKPPPPPPAPPAVDGASKVPAATAWRRSWPARRAPAAEAPSRPQTSGASLKWRRWIGESSASLARTHDEGAAVAAARRRTPSSGVEGRRDPANHFSDTPLEVRRGALSAWGRRGGSGRRARRAGSGGEAGGGGGGGGEGR